jgi:hypothetical protein
VIIQQAILALCGGRTGILGGRVAAGGVTLVQLGDKEGDTRRLVEEACAIKAATASTSRSLPAPTASASAARELRAIVDRAVTMRVDP